MKQNRKKKYLPGMLLAVGSMLLLGLVLLLSPRDETAVIAGETSLQFSEVCVKNETIIADNEEKYRDYIEIFNGGTAVNLQGYYLTNGNVKSAPLGDYPLPAGGYCLLFVDTDLTGFSLGADGGDCIQLMNPEGAIAAQVTTQPMNADQVMLRAETGYMISTEATPGFAGNAAGVAAFRTGTQVEELEIRISEVLTENISACPDERGQFSDVVELYNSSDRAVYLGAYTFSDSTQNRFRYRLPGVTLEAGEYLLLYCDGENYIGENGEIHVNFGLSKGDEICLTDREGKFVICPVEFPSEDISLSLDDEGIYKPSAVSLGFANDTAGAESYVNLRMEEQAYLVINEVLLSAAEIPYMGEVCDVVEIYNRSQQTVSTEGWYLSDGGDPYTFKLPETKLAPGEYMVIRCSREETGYALSQRDTLCLFTPQYRWASRVDCSQWSAGQSICRTAENRYTTGAVSLGYENSAAGAEAYERQRLTGLWISEVMTANASYMKGPYGRTTDWVELYNGGAEAIWLGDYTLSTGLEEAGFSLPQQDLAPGEWIILHLSDKSDRYVANRQYLPLNLSSQGENLYLRKDGFVIDYVNIPSLPSDRAYGRPADGFGFVILQEPTPGSANSCSAELSAAPTALTAPGTYEVEGGVEVVLSGEGTLYYTTNCTTPTTASTPYTGPILLNSTTVLRVMAQEEGKLPSSVIDLTYVINEGHELPVVSLVTEPKNLWDPSTGIYMEGPNADPVFPHPGANYWQPWEKAASVSLYEEDGSGFSANCGLAIFGAYSRALAIKPFSCYFRDSYGDGELQYALFGEEGLNSYESFVLRCGGQDFLKARVRDVLITSLVAEQTNVAVQKYRPVVLYLNGDFWGVYFIREKINENYVAGNYNVAEEDVTLCEANGSDSAEYMELMAYVKSHDLSEQEHYDYVCSQIDVDVYIDYILAEIYVANSDNGNIKFFKTTEGKWTWILYDTDYGFTDSTSNTFISHLNPGGTGNANAYSTALINGLLRNPQFKEKFLRRLAWQIDNIWSVENVNAHIDALQAILQTDMTKDQDRWFRHAGSWEYHMDLLRSYTQTRNEHIPEFVRSYFKLTTEQLREYGFHV